MGEGTKGPGLEEPDVVLLKLVQGFPQLSQVKFDLLNPVI